MPPPSTLPRARQRSTRLAHRGPRADTWRCAWLVYVHTAGPHRGWKGPGRCYFCLWPQSPSFTYSTEVWARGTVSPGAPPRARNTPTHSTRSTTATSTTTTTAAATATAQNQDHYCCCCFDTVGIQNTCSPGPNPTPGPLTAKTGQQLYTTTKSQN